MIRRYGWIGAMVMMVSGSLHAEGFAGAPEGDMGIWIALFGLAVIGVFAIYLSSERAREITQIYTAMQEAQHEVETRQNILLEVIGDRLENSTQGLRRHREALEEQSRKRVDREAIAKVVTRFRRDEHLLMDATRDLKDFSKIRLGKVELENVLFDTAEMLKRLSQKVEPHQMLKRNEVIFRYDPNALAQIQGDSQRIEQVLQTFLVALSDDLHEGTLILSIEADANREQVMFDLRVPHGEAVLPVHEDISVVWDDANPEAHYSTRKLKNYIAHELIALMGGTLTRVPTLKEEIHYRITLPAHVEGRAEPLVFPDDRVMIVSHNETTATSIHDAMALGVPVERIARRIVGDGSLPDLNRFETVVITYGSLNEEWVSYLHSHQSIRPIRVIVLKNGFERSAPVPERLEVAQTLRLPLLPEKLAEAMAMPLKTSRKSTAINVA